MSTDPSTTPLDPTWARIIDRAVDAAVTTALARFYDQILCPIEWLSTEQAAAYLGVDDSYLLGWRRHNEGPPYTKVGRLVRYRRQDVLDYMNALPVTMPRVVPSNG